MKKALTDAGATAKVVAPHGGTLAAARGAKIAVDFSLLTVGSVLFDAGRDSAKALADDAMAILFVSEAYKHCKALAVTGAGTALLPTNNGGNAAAKGAGAKVTTLEEGVIAGGDGDVAQVGTEFIKAIARHRAWSREAKGQRVPV